MKTLLSNARILKMNDEDLFFGNIVIENDRIIFADDQIPKVDFRIDSENKTIEQVADEVYRLYWKKLKNIK